MARAHAREAAHEGVGELNLVPYLDILINLMLFMLVTYEVALPTATISVDPPASAPGPASPLAMLTVVVSGDGFRVLTNGGQLGAETIPRSGDLDYAELTARLTRIQATTGADPRVIVVATPETPYETLVHTLDACRTRVDGKPLYPDVTLGLAVGAAR